MTKDAYYFPHDSNAKDDPKCILLIEQLGCEGYGIFWILLETLRDQPNWRCTLAVIPAIARRYNTTQDKVNHVIRGYNLFQIQDGEFFFSESFSRRMQVIENKRLGLIEAGRRGGKKTQQKLAELSHPQASLEPPSSSKGKERKRNEIKEKEIKKRTMSGKPDDIHPEVIEVINHLNYVVGTKYQPSGSQNTAFINARLSAGFTVDDCKKVIDKKAKAWKHDNKMRQYLRPTTLFNESKFENYLNEPEPIELDEFDRKFFNNVRT